MVVKLEKVTEPLPFNLPSTSVILFLISVSLYTVSLAAIVILSFVGVNVILFPATIFSVSVLLSAAIVVEPILTLLNAF